MIPEELHLQGFLSHRDTVLDLRGFHLAVLIGENGAGKSALLDAITWAVWGKSRASSDDTLITHGEMMATVEYTFRMPYQNGSERRFRILRRRKRHSKGAQTTLDFQEEIEGEWASLNAGSVRQTQQAIIEALRMEYDTFLNSAYLRQGHADEFSSRRPAERKRVLADILGLDAWEGYRERVKERYKEATIRRDMLEKQIDDLRKELAQRADYEAKLQSAQARVEEAALRRRAAEEALAELDRLEEQARTIRRRLEDLERRRAEEEARLRETREQMTAKRVQVADYRRTIDGEADIRARLERYRALQEEERRWSEKLQAVHREMQAKAEAQARIEAEAARLRREHDRLLQEAEAQETLIEAEAKRLRGEIRRLEEEALHHERRAERERGEAEKRLSALQAEVETLRKELPDEALQQRLEEAEARLQAMAAQEEALRQTRQQLQHLLAEESRLEERIEQAEAALVRMREETQVIAGATAQCPLCLQPLTAEHQQHLLEEREADVARQQETIAALRRQLADIRQEKGRLQSLIRTHEWELRRRSDLESEVARLRQQAQRRTAIEARIAALTPQIAELEGRIGRGEIAAEARAEAERLRAEAAALQAKLEAGDFAAEARATLAAITARLAAVGYDEEAHQAARQALAALAAVEEEYRALEAARVGLREAEETLAHLEKEERERRERLQTLTAEAEAARSELDGLRPRLRQRPELELRRDEARTEEAKARRELGIVQQHLATLEQLPRRLAKLEAEVEQLDRRIGLLKELRTAFGVNGIPAMIIEHTLPQLEAEANAILSKLSGGKMHIRFETQRLTKAGNSRETLDIIISDEEGERPYENFSGGERFRIDFAVRIALSRLLANRAGVQLRSLFIDEGFGALDADGRRRLIEAVKEVQDDFDLILVVTHITEMQDAFPVRIRVDRYGDGGSRVRIL